MDSTKLKAQTVKDLAEMARKKGVVGWHSMRKDQLVRALLKQGKLPAEKRGKLPAAKRVNVVQRINQVQAQQALGKDLAVKSVAQHNGHTKDRLVVLVLDPYWLHVYWELTRTSIDRARAAMGQHWHGARPVLRLHAVTADGTTNTARCVIRQMEIHGGVNNWYVNVDHPPKSYQMDIGYLGVSGKFYALARSNVVSTPSATDGQTFDHNWDGVARDCERIFVRSSSAAEQNGDHEVREVLEEHIHRPITPPHTSRIGFGDVSDDPDDDGVSLQGDAALIVFGTADPNARVTMRGEPVRLRADGSFAVRFGLPERRQVLPVVASSGDGLQQRTIVLAVERNTKVMEPVTRDTSE